MGPELVRSSAVFFRKRFFMSITVFIADDHEVIRKGLVSLFRGSEIKIVAEAKNGDEAAQWSASTSRKLYCSTFGCRHPMAWPR